MAKPVAARTMQQIRDALYIHGYVATCNDVHNWVTDCRTKFGQSYIYSSDLKDAMITMTDEGALVRISDELFRLPDGCLNARMSAMIVAVLEAKRDEATSAVAWRAAMTARTLQDLAETAAEAGKAGGDRESAATRWLQYDEKRGQYLWEHPAQSTREIGDCVRMALDCQRQIGLLNATFGSQCADFAALVAARRTELAEAITADAAVTA